MNKQFLLAGLLSLAHCALNNAACGDLALSATVFSPQAQLNIIHLPPQFTDVDVECDTSALALCSPALNVTENTIALDTTTPGAYTDINDYNFLRSNKSIFPTFDNQLVLTPTFLSPNGNHFGTAVAISGDGSTIAIGSNDNTAAIYCSVDIYQRRNNTWLAIQHLTQPPGIPTSSNDTSSPYFGGSLALSYDGSVLAVGGVQAGGEPYPGHVFMYTYQLATNSYQLQQTILGSSASGFGQFLDLSADGTYLLINDSSTPPTSTAIKRITTAWVYARSSSCNTNCTSSGQWEEQTLLIPVVDDVVPVTQVAILDNLFAKNIALSGDGTTAAIGALGINEGR